MKTVRLKQKDCSSSEAAVEGAGGNAAWKQSESLTEVRGIRRRKRTAGSSRETENETKRQRVISPRPGLIFIQTPESGFASRAPPHLPFLCYSPSFPSPLAPSITYSLSLSSSLHNSSPLISSLPYGIYYSRATGEKSRAGPALQKITAIKRSIHPEALRGAAADAPLHFGACFASKCSICPIAALNWPNIMPHHVDVCPAQIQWSLDGVSLSET